MHIVVSLVMFDEILIFSALGVLAGLLARNCSLGLSDLASFLWVLGDPIAVAIFFIDEKVWVVYFFAFVFGIPIFRLTARRRHVEV